MPIDLQPRGAPWTMVLRRRARVLAAVAAAAVVAAGGCSRAPQPAVSPIRSDGVASLPAAAASASAAHAGTPAADSRPQVSWRRPEGEAEVEAALGEARARNLPVFLYWGAVWCPPCNQVKATVFSRPDFVEKSRGFVAVYLDGDSVAAQKLGARLRVSGYPTMVLLRADGSELTRLPGGVEAARYLEVLDLGLAARQTAAELLAQARSTPAVLKADDWRRLAYYAWEADEQQLVPAARLADALAQLAAACPPRFAESATRLMLLADVARLSRGKGSARSGAVWRAARDRWLAALGDEALAHDNIDLIAGYARELTEALTAAGTTERKRLQVAWAAALDRLSADASLSQGDRMAALVARVDLDRPDLSKSGQIADPRTAAVSKELQERVRLEVARADREVSSEVERQAVIADAAQALSLSGQLDASDALLTAELGRSHSPYCFMLGLADNARARGDRAGALAWGERAWREARGPATRLQWGASYLNLLLELAPQDTARIGSVGLALLEELQGQPGAFYGRTQRRLEATSRRLLAWNTAAPRAAVLEQLRARREILCETLRDDPSQQARCAVLFAGPAAPTRGGTAS